MNLKNILFICLSLILETFIFVIFAFNSLSPRLHKTVLILFLTLMQILFRVLFDKIGFISIVPSIFFDLITLSVGFKDKLRKKIFIVLLFYSLIIAIDSLSALVIIIFVKYFDICGTTDSFLLYSVLLSKAILYGIIKILGDRLSLNTNFINWIEHISTPILIIVTIMWGSPFTFNTEIKGITEFLFAICIICIYTTFYLIVYLIRTNEKILLEQKLKALNEFKKLSAEHYSELRQAYKTVEQTAHDLLHHLNYLESAEDLETVRNYVIKLKGRSISKALMYTGNFDIDVIINSKHSEIEKQGISLNVKGSLPHKIDWLDSIDVAIILGNSLNNAIEACKTGDCISLFFRYDEHRLLITIENPTDAVSVPKKTGFGLVSTKKGSNHGIGMEAMAESVKQYDGIVKYDIKNGKFILDILLHQ